jgi:hypothetical protein
VATSSLAAATGESGAPISPLWISVAGLVILLGTGAAAVYYARRERAKDETSAPEEGFDIE